LSKDFPPSLSVPSRTLHHSQPRIKSCQHDWYVQPVLPLQAGELSVKLDPYIRTRRRDWDGESAETQIWPLIKYVEVILPKSALIPEGVVLVDIPGTGDFNSKRDKMWKKVILLHGAHPSSLYSSIPSKQQVGIL
jgi:hypothetical protein